MPSTETAAGNTEFQKFFMIDLNSECKKIRLHSYHIGRNADKRDEEKMAQVATDEADGH